MIGEQNCGVMPVSFMQALAAAVMRDSDGATFLNMRAIVPWDGRCDCEPVYDCSMQGINLENFVVSNIFGVDDCGNTVLKIGLCDVHIPPR
jgi:hypothetical protein